MCHRANGSPFCSSFVIGLTGPIIDLVCTRGYGKRHILVLWRLFPLRIIPEDGLLSIVEHSRCGLFTAWIMPVMDINDVRSRDWIRESGSTGLKVTWTALLAHDVGEHIRHAAVSCCRLPNCRRVGILQTLDYYCRPLRSRRPFRPL